MNDDFRVKNSFVRNIKTFKMIQKFGEGSVFWLLKIWAYASENCTNGIFEGYSDTDIEYVANLPTEAIGKFVKSLHEIGFIDYNNGVYSLHNWPEHNPWVVEEDSRKNTYRLNALSKYNKDLYNLLKNNGITGITADDLATLKAAKNPISEAKKLFKISKAEKQSAIAENCTSNAPCNCTCNADATDSAIAPPLTSTLTSTNTNIKNTLKDSCAELSCDSSTPEDSSNQNAMDKFLDLPLNTGESHWVTVGEVELWESLYPAVDVRQQLRAMKGWLFSNQKNRKTTQGIKRFINGWLQREQDRARPDANRGNVAAPQKTFQELEEERQERLRLERRARAREYDRQQELKNQQEGQDEARAI